MTYILFTADNCHQCEEVEASVRSLDILIEVKNVDTEGEQPPISTFAYPALFKGNILIAYGTDILDYLKKRNEA